MKIVCISDTHEQHEAINVPNGDVLVHAGDITYTGDPWKILAFAKWFRAQPHTYKILIAGNHDFLFQEEPEFARSLVEGITYLEDSGCEIEGLKFWGSPWTPRFGAWAFMKDRGEEILGKWKAIPEGIDVLLTHGPARGLLDQARPPYSEALGCFDLQLELLRIAPKLHVFGHIHGGRGLDNSRGYVSVNAACVNEAYRPVEAKPFVVEL